MWVNLRDGASQKSEPDIKLRGGPKRVGLARFAILTKGCNASFITLIPKIDNLVALDINGVKTLGQLCEEPKVVKEVVRKFF